MLFFDYKLKFLQKRNLRQKLLFFCQVSFIVWFNKYKSDVPCNKNHCKIKFNVQFQRICWHISMDFFHMENTGIKNYWKMWLLLGANFIKLPLSLWFCSKFYCVARILCRVHHLQETHQIHLLYTVALKNRLIHVI